MKKTAFLSILILGSLCFMAAYPGRPLFGTASNQDNTGRALTYAYKAIGDTLGATPDTVTIIPDGYTKVYALTLKDSCCLCIKTTSTSYTGSHIEVLINNGAVSGWVQFIGYSGLATQWAMTSGTTKISPTASHVCVLEFVCDGSKWQEEFKSQN